MKAIAVSLVLLVHGAADLSPEKRLTKAERDALVDWTRSTR